MAGTATTGCATMTIGVLGAGAMGSLLAGMLAAAGEPVVLLARPSAHAAAIARGGLVIERPGGVEARIPVRVATEPAAVSAATCLIVLVKHWATTEALEPLAPWLGNRTLVVSLQNGLGTREALLASLPGHPVGLVASGVTAQAAMATEAGRVAHTGTGPTVLGFPGNGDPEPVRALAATMTRAGWDATAAPDIRQATWRKLAVNAAINGIGALAAVPNGWIADRDDLRALAGRIADEVAAVADAEGVEVGDAAEAVIAVSRASAANRSSMLRDIERGQRTEVDAIHGAIAVVAKRHGIDAPLVGALATMIRARESRAMLGDGEGQPIGGE